MTKKKTNWYAIPMEIRVATFLEERSGDNTWYSIRAIAGETHIAIWQAEHQLNEMSVKNTVIFEIDRGDVLYRWRA